MEVKARFACKTETKTEQKLNKNRNKTKAESKSETTRNARVGEQGIALVEEVTHPWEARSAPLAVGLDKTYILKKQKKTS